MAKQKIIVLATPSLGEVSIYWSKQLMNLAWPLNMGRRVDFIRDSIGGEIAESRNFLVDKNFKLAAKSGVEIDSFFWVDDDVLIFQTALLQLYNHHLPMVSGVYFTKCETCEPLIFPSKGGGTLKFEPDKLIEVWGHGMGLTLVKADLYLKLAETVGKDKYGRPEWYKTVNEYKIEGAMLNGGGTEDLYFCDLVAQLGVKTFVDTSKHAFGFHYDRKRNIGYPLPQYRQFEKAEAVTWPDGVVWE